MMNSKLEEFFVTLLQEIYWSEQHLVTVLSTMSKAATTSELKNAFDRHRDQTQSHIQRLEDTFGKLNLPPQAEPSAGLQGLFDEGWQVIDETQEGSAQRDVALIIAAQKVEHYEIAAYGGLAVNVEGAVLYDIEAWRQGYVTLQVQVVTISSWIEYHGFVRLHGDLAVGASS